MTGPPARVGGPADDDGPTVGSGPLRYRWRSIDSRGYCSPDTWSHPGLALREDGNLVVVETARRELLDLDPTGAVVSLVPAPVGNAHAIAPASGPGHLWLADNGDVSNLVDGEIVRSDWVGSVVEVDLEGNLVARLDPPGHAAYRGGAFRPTGVAAIDGRSGTDEAVWVADGYGLSLVLRYDPSGGYRGAIDGTETGTAFDCPHGLLVDRRTAEPRLLVADRGNARICVYDLDGRFVGTVGEGHLTSPSSLALAGDRLVVAELRASLAFFDAADRWMGSIGGWPEAPARGGWPNDASGGHVSVPALPAGRFNSPHGLAAAPDGRIYVAEWLLGGRLTELVPA